MNLLFKPVDGYHYAMNVKMTLDKKSLKWDSHGNSHFLIIKSKYGECVDLSGDELRNALKEVSELLLEEQPVKILSDLKVHFISNATYVCKGSCYEISKEAATYAIFCCSYINDECTLYIPTDECMYQKNVSASIAINIIPEKKGILKKLTGNYIITIEKISDYLNGTIYYQVDDYKYPVTNEMLNNKFVLTASPKFFSTDKGLTLQCNFNN